MKLTLFVISAFIAGAATTHITQQEEQDSEVLYSCDQIIGSWVGKSENSALESSNRYVETYLPKGLYVSRFTTTDSTGFTEAQTERRIWFCDGENFGTYLVSTSSGATPLTALAPYKVYKILHLDQNTFKYQTLIGYSVGKVYEDRRLAENQN